VRSPLSAPDLSQEEVTLAAQRSEVLFERSHPLAYRGNAPL
jgi:hypothetical protein